VADAAHREGRVVEENGIPEARLGDRCAQDVAVEAAS
jgi:hypothetical protein